VKNKKKGPLERGGPGLAGGRAGQKERLNNLSQKRKGKKKNRSVKGPVEGEAEHSWGGGSRTARAAILERGVKAKRRGLGRKSQALVQKSNREWGRLEDQEGELLSAQNC